MKKQDSFWERNKLDLIPSLYCVLAFAIIGGAYMGITEYNMKKQERKEAKAVFDSINQAKDTIALSVANQQQK